MSARLMLRITGPFILGSFLLLSLGIGAAWYVHRLQRQSSALAANYVKSVRVAHDLAISLRDIRTQLNRYLSNNSSRELDVIPDYIQEIQRSLHEAADLAQTSEERELIVQLTALHEQFVHEYRNALRATPLPERKEALSHLKDELLSQVFLTKTTAFLELNQKMVAETSARNQRVTQWMVYGLVLQGLCGAVAGLLAGFGIARVISSRLVRLTVPIRDAAGKLDEVVGSIPAGTAASGFEEIQGVLETMAQQVRQVVERLHQSQQQALRAEQLAAVGQLAAGMAHELRNPLTAMKILVQSAVERSEQTPMSQRDLAVLEEEITRQEQIINMFLDFARPPQAEKRVLDLRSVVEHSVARALNHATPHNVEFHVSVPDQAVLIAGDVVQLRQLLINLLLNARDAVSQEGHVWIELTREKPTMNPDHHTRNGTPGDGQAGWAVLRVADNGCGLPDALGERIFDPFISTKVTGIGLGLSICKRIVEVHGGDLRADDRTEGGAVFTIRLPLTVSTHNNGIGSLEQVAGVRSQKSGVRIQGSVTPV
ncbi:MAG: ATP-binding protein [Gemmataceae bacterium]